MLLWVFLGGGLGSAARYLSVAGVGRLIGQGHPLGTFSVNVVGSFAIGFLSALFLTKLAGNDHAKAMVITGFLGGFTTYSAYALDIVNLMQKGENIEALAYAMGTLVVCVMACFGGLLVSRLFFA